jgi:hypothetical protein
MNKTTTAEVMDLFKIWESELKSLNKTYTMTEIREIWVMINWKVQVVL